MSRNAISFRIDRCRDGLHMQGSQEPAFPNACSPQNSASSSLLLPLVLLPLTARPADSKATAHNFCWERLIPTQTHLPQGALAGHVIPEGYGGHRGFVLTVPQHNGQIRPVLLMVVAEWGKNEIRHDFKKEQEGEKLQ